MCSSDLSLKSMIDKTTKVTWECPRCGLIHHILTQTCSCSSPLINSSTTTIASTGKETLYVQVECDYYTKKEIDEKFKVLDVIHERMLAWTKEDDDKSAHMQSLCRKGVKIEEQAWRKALLDFLSLPNCGIIMGEHIPREEAEQRLLNLSRFLSDK